jgi:WhiB family redox-sensing transcriptional regulator
MTNRSARHRSRGDQTWQNEAVCQPTEYPHVDPEIFFPEPDEMDKIRAAKALCAQCPVRQTCLDAALESGDTFGIRGGMTEEEREPLHENLPARLDYSRVNAFVAGQDVHLTKAERRAVVLAAHRHGVSEERLAWLLKVSPQHAKRLYREARRALRHREMEQTTNTTTPAPPGRHGAALGRDDFGTAA